MASPSSFGLHHHQQQQHHRSFGSNNSSSRERSSMHTNAAVTANTHHHLHHDPSSNRRRSTNNLVPPPANNSSSGGGGNSRKSWGGKSNSSNDNEMMMDPYHQHRGALLSASTSGTSNNSGSISNNSNSDQLANIKNQWNVQRDIPSGTVKNNPFVPKPTEPSYRPQLAQQKKQWDTRDIPKGNVAAKAMSAMRGITTTTDEIMMASPRSNMSPRRSGNSPNNNNHHHHRVESPQHQRHHTHHHKGGGVRGGGAFPMTHPSSTTAAAPSPIGGGGTLNNTRSHASQSSPASSLRVQTNATQSSPASSLRVQTNASQSSPASLRVQTNAVTTTTTGTSSSSSGAKTNLRGRLIENPFLQQQQQQQQQTSSNSTTKMTSPRGWEPSKEIPKGTVKGRASRFGSAKQGSPLSIIGPNTNTNMNNSSSQVSLTPTKSVDSEEDPWIIPKTTRQAEKVFPGDWGEAVAKSGSDEWDDTHKDDWYNNSGESQDGEDDDDTFAEKKTPEVDPFTTKTTTTTTMPPPSSSSRDPFHTVHERETDILQAATQKKMKPKKYLAPKVIISPPLKDADGGVVRRGVVVAAPKVMLALAPPPKDDASLDALESRRLLAPPPKDASAYHRSRGGGEGVGAATALAPPSKDTNAHYDQPKDPLVLLTKRSGQRSTTGSRQRQRSLDFFNHDGEATSDKNNNNNAFDPTAFDAGAFGAATATGGGFDEDPFDAASNNFDLTPNSSNNNNSYNAFQVDRHGLHGADSNNNNALDNRRAAEEERRRDEMRRAAKLEEERRREEEEHRAAAAKIEEERRKVEQQRRMDEELHQEELHQEELRLMEEHRREEERHAAKLEERRQEELRRMEERRIEEMHKIEEDRRREKAYYNEPSHLDDKVSSYRHGVAEQERKESQRKADERHLQRDEYAPRDQILQEESVSYEDNSYAVNYDASTTEYTGPPESESRYSSHTRSTYSEYDGPNLQDEQYVSSRDYHGDPVDEPKDSRSENDPGEAMSEDELEMAAPKKKKKGFFKFFGRKDKEKEKESKSNKKGRKSLPFGQSRKSGGNSNRKSEPPLKESSRVSNSNVVSRNKQRQEKKHPVPQNEDIDHNVGSSVENIPETETTPNYQHELYNGSGIPDTEMNQHHLYNGSGEDDTTISDMTLPTVFKDGLGSPRHQALHATSHMPPQLSTIMSRDLSTSSSHEHLHKLDPLLGLSTSSSHLVEDEHLHKLDPLLGLVDEDARQHNLELALSRAERAQTPKTTGHRRNKGNHEHNLELALSRAERAQTPKTGHRRNKGNHEPQNRYGTAPPPPPPPPSPPPSREETQAAANTRDLYDDPALDHVDVDDFIAEDGALVYNESADPDLDHLNMDETDTDEDEPGLITKETEQENMIETEADTLEASRPTTPLSVVRRRKAMKLQQNKKIAKKNLPAPPSMASNSTKQSGSSAPRRFNPRARTSTKEPATPPHIERVTDKKAFSPTAEKKQAATQSSAIPRKAPRFVERHTQAKRNTLAPPKPEEDRHSVPKRKIVSSAKEKQPVQQQENMIVVAKKEGSGKTYEQKSAKANGAFRHHGKSSQRELAQTNYAYSHNIQPLMSASTVSEESSKAPSKLTPYQQQLNNSILDSVRSARTNEKLTPYQQQLNNSILDSVRSARTNDNSIHSNRSMDSASVGSDIRVLRSILRRPRRAEAPVTGTKPRQPVFPSYNEKNISDPMQRAGLRLLSAAIIPIQTEVRRFIAMRRALTRMWALIVIQTYSRRWIARKQYVKEINSIVTIQAVARKRAVQSDLIYQHICAIEIQRFMRGYLATMQVYEDIYKVTMVQSYVRMRIARNEATYRMALVIQAQAAARGFLVRRRLAYQNACATAIQANWRCFYSRLTYQFDLLDIVIVQSFWRKRAAAREVARLRHAHHERSATMIQTQWRSYDSTMNYLHYLADVLISQGAVRRFLAKKRVERIKYYNATTIQTAVRGYIQRNRLSKYYAARQVQTCVRMFLCMTYLKKCYAARKIQATWRGGVAARDYNMYVAAKTIQATWRGGVAARDYNMYVAAKTIQATWRGGVAARDYNMYVAAKTIQKTWRGHACYNNYTKDLAARAIQKLWRGYVCFNDYKQMAAARTIQKMWRGHVYFNDYKQMTAARTIQNMWRGHVCFNDYKRFTAARTIQKMWRGHMCFGDYKHYLAARVIQKTWRGHVCFVDRKQYYAAREIQSAWRGFVCYADYMFTIADVVVVQKLARGWLAKRRAYRLRNIASIDLEARLKIQRAWRLYAFRKHREEGAIAIQKTWRCFAEETEYVVMKYEYYAVRTIQSHWRRFWCFSNFIIALDCSIQIQAVFRGYQQRKELKIMHLAATWIQSGCRSYLAKKEASLRAMVQALVSSSVIRSGDAMQSSTLIQSHWRMSKARNAYVGYCSARQIQRLVRGHQARTAVNLYTAATKIQTAWRRFVPYTMYKTYDAARRIQNLWRSKNLHKAYRFYRSALTIQRRFRGMRERQQVLVIRGQVLAAMLIQGAWRGFVCYTDYVFTISDIIATQKRARGYLARKQYRGTILTGVQEKRHAKEAATKIQTVTRSFLERQRYWYTLGCTMQLQSWIRGRLVILRLRRDARARLTLQCFARRCFARQMYLQRMFIFNLIKTAEQEKKQKIAALRIQEAARAKMEQTRREHAARVIQRFFLMVKREVDRMMREKRRRRKNRRKSTMHRADRIDEDLLEDAWSFAITNSNLENEPIHPHMSNLAPSKEWSPSLDWTMDERTMDETSYMRQSQSKSFDPSGINKVDSIGSSRRAGSDNQQRKGSDRGQQQSQQQQQIKNRHRLPPGYSDKPSTIVRLTHMEDDISEFSGHTYSTHYGNRPPPSRILLSPREMDDDLELEEAWIDTEICSAKERRMADSHNRKRGGRNVSPAPGRMSPAPLRMAPSVASSSRRSGRNVSPALGRMSPAPLRMAPSVASSSRRSPSLSSARRPSPARGGSSSRQQQQQQQQQQEEQEEQEQYQQFHHQRSHSASSSQHQSSQHQQQHRKKDRHHRVPPRVKVLSSIEGEI
jgi:hypothetical protein